ncbi:MAG: hypothetical protein KF691_00480 [Phycisphaeraceae bacterium]|nr:hypothetical protein [Phycisphaeraceae bacterium]
MAGKIVDIEPLPPGEVSQIARPLENQQMMSGFNKLGVLVGVAGLAIGAMAQMTTPPAQKPEGWPKETPIPAHETKHETITMEEAIRRGLIDPSANKTPGENPQGQPAQPAQPSAEHNLTKDEMHTNYDQWERDGSGHVIKLDRPLQWAAIERNKTITPATREKIQAFINQRRAKVEQTVLENMDKVRFLDSGVLETFSMGERDNLKQVLADTKPFTNLGPFATELKKADLFTQNNVQQHQIIVDDYRRLMLDDMKRDSSGSGDAKQGATDLVARAMFLTMADEARQVYYWMLADSVNDAATRVTEIGVSADVAPKVVELFNQAKASKDEADRVAKMREGVAFLTPEQTRQLVEPVVKSSTASTAKPESQTTGSATSDASKPGDR